MLNKDLLLLSSLPYKYVGQEDRRCRGHRGSQPHHFHLARFVLDPRAFLDVQKSEKCYQPMDKNI
jgi:hypothetical protein